MRLAYARGMGLAAQAAAVGRHDALIASALSAQRAGRALIARHKVASRRKAITTLQAFFRGCKERAGLSTALEERCSASLQRTIESRYKGGVRSGDDEGSHAGVKSKCEDRTRLHVEADDPCLMQVGTMTERNVPMDAACPSGFDTPNLAAFLWKHDWKEDDGSDAGTTPIQRSQLNDGDYIEASYGDAVFEVSARAFVSTKKNGEHGDRRHNSISHDCRSLCGEGTQHLSPVLHSSCRAVRVPVAVAPEKSLARALGCSTLIVNSPSFGSACARRLFSRIGRSAFPSLAQAPHSASGATANGARKTAYDTTVSTRGGGTRRAVGHHISRVTASRT